MIDLHYLLVLDEMRVQFSQTLIEFPNVQFRHCLCFDSSIYPSPCFGMVILFVRRCNFRKNNFGDEDQGHHRGRRRGPPKTQPRRERKRERERLIAHPDGAPQSETRVKFPSKFTRGRARPAM